MLKKPLRYPVTITRRRVRIVTCKLLIMVERNKYVCMFEYTVHNYKNSKSYLHASKYVYSM